MVPKRVLEDIRARCDIVDVVGTYLHLQRAGATFRALCPFHKEKTPSFHVNPQRQIFHCFGCGEGGDVFRFVMKHESVEFMTAVRMLAEKAGIRLEFEGGEKESGPAKDVLYRLQAEVADLYHRALLKSPSAAAAREYLKSRSLPEDIVKEFQIGYAPDQWDAILKWAEKKYTTEQLEASGLIIKSDKPGSEGRHYDRFRNRVMFPIRDEQGRVTAFSGRTLEKDSPGAKYVNSPETALFRKSRVLYALDKARHAMTESRRAIVCEGQIDVIRCHQAGFKEAVASQGTAFTEDHARILRRYADEVVLMFDSDRAGQEAAVKTARVFMPFELSVRVAMLPKGEDPDSFILKQGRDAFAAIIDAARSVVDFQVDVFAPLYRAETAAGLTQLTRAVLETIGRTPNAVQQDQLIGLAAKRLGHSYPGSLKAELAQILRRARPRESDPTAEVPEALKQPAEEVLLAEHVVTDAALGALVEEYLPLRLLTDDLCRSVIDAAIESHKQGAELADILSNRDDPQGVLARFAAQVQMAPPKTIGREYSPADAVKGLILRIWQREAKRRIQAIEESLQTAAGKKHDEFRAESAQLRADLKGLARWDTGAAIIKMLL